MKHKKSVLLITTLSLGMTSVYAQYSNQQGRGSRINPTVEKCNAYYKTLTDTTDPQARQQQINNSKDVRMECENHRLTAQYLGNSFEGVQDFKTTRDKNITCAKAAGWTADYRSCLEALKIYDTIQVAEQAMFAYQKVEMDYSIQKSEKKVAESAAQGDLQGAAIDAQNQHIRKMKELNVQQRNAYAAAVAGLGTALTRWQADSEKSLVKLCGEQKGGAEQAVAGEAEAGADEGKDAQAVGTSFLVAGETRPNCATAMTNLYRLKPDEVIANKHAKSAFILALTDYIGKAAKAGITASQFSEITKQLNIQQPKFEETTAQFEYCAANPMDKNCLGPGNRVDRGAFGGHDEFTFDVGGMNNFGGAADSQTFGEEGLATNIKDDHVVGDIGSPFLDDAKVASGILDPAGAASASPGGGGAGGGGGGGGGLGGGGSATLGNDLAGVDENADKVGEIKTNKISGNYEGGGATGFSALKEAKESANPYASLFDSEGGAGGIVEERSIASGADIDGAASGLFQKISKRYNKVHADKRLEAKNLE